MDDTIPEEIGPAVAMLIRVTVARLVSDLLLDDRIADDQLPIGAIEEAVCRGWITHAAMVAEFDGALFDGLGFVAPQR